ncbi:cysteine desulfurase family protein [Arthrobacter sp. AZCC_0090]|uniref:cysteine desulfurase family protein n=1 Tax=Arthrobacter sp. AZCC_0090 TaxID=2735881 RepID=UPI00161CD753|nr:cysteine desulfurase family protein [Arthrobacter sp. AZCC_0090]MBB6403887.1 cysteine desulfurase [Arthrobacter sp. AZCC_0090]
MPVYLDHAATTPLAAVALSAMTRELGRTGNPSSLHASGRRARRAVEEAREAIAAAAGAHPSELIFTSGGTEADNLAVKGLYWARHDEDGRRKRILCSAVEHHAVQDTVEWLERHEGAEAVWLPVDSLGVVRLDAVRAEIERDPGSVALVTVMWANNEVGTIQPVKEIVEIAAPHGIPVHSDAVQAFGSIPLGFRESGLAAMSVSSHKIGGPVGVGALFLGRSTKVTPVQHGGGQERDVRSGTLDTASIAAFAAAAESVAKNLPAERERISALRDRIIDGVRAVIPEAVLRGAPGDARLPGNAHFTFPGCEGDSLLFLLDLSGIESSTGSACTAGVPRPSHVLLAMGLDEDTARGAQRFSLGHSSNDADVDALLKALPDAYARAKLAGMAGHESSIQTAATVARGSVGDSASGSAGYAASGSN